MKNQISEFWALWKAALCGLNFIEGLLSGGNNQIITGSSTYYDSEDIRYNAIPSQDANLCFVGNTFQLAATDHQNKANAHMHIQSSS